MDCVLSLFLGLFIIPVSCDFPPGSCDGYTAINEPWRNRAFFASTTSTGFSQNDTNFLDKWLRFTGIGGDTVVTSCVTVQTSATLVPIFIPFPLPTNLSLYPTNGTAQGCNDKSFSLSVALCPGGFYVYKPVDPLPAPNMVYVTYHSECTATSCGSLGNCTDGGCTCNDGYEMPPDYLATSNSYGCIDIDECTRTKGICGRNTNCFNTVGSYSCNCWTGFQMPTPILKSKLSPGCEDIDECLSGVCGPYGTCYNNIGSFVCNCSKGFRADYSMSPVCQDIDECYNSTICGPYSICQNLPGNYSCSCKVGFEPMDKTNQPNETNVCTDINECTLPVCSTCIDICGPDCNCSNTIGSYLCTCIPGYRINNPAFIASYDNPCRDIDECTETPGICGEMTVCTNVPGTFYCSCPDGLFPTTGIVAWILNVTYCQSVEDALNKVPVKEGQTKEISFISNMQDDLTNNTGAFIPEATVANSFAASMAVSGVGPRATESKVSSEGDGAMGNAILDLSEYIVVAMTPPTENQTKKEVHSSTVDLSLLAIGPGSKDNWNTSLSANGNTMDFNLQAIAHANNGSATAAFMTLNGMESLLSHQYFQTEKKTEMCSDVITAVIPVNNTNLTEPVNFTIYHRKEIPETGTVSCVYWKTTETVEGKSMSWSEEGCWIAFSNENYTICSCSHLSTFALIMQIGEPTPSNPFLEWLNRVCVIIGLFFLALAILTFLLCSWNPKINNTARLHLCLNLFFSQLLLLWNDKYTDNKLACTVMAGLLHFLIVASFVWMLLEALQLHLLVRRLSKVQVIRRDGLPRPILYLVGYGVPFVIVGVSALIYSDGYGVTSSNVCFLSTKRNFNWALTGPIVAVLAINWLLFLATLWSLRPTLANMKSDVSQSKDTRLIVFKIVAQFVILGCTWILGLYQTNLFFQVLFIILNSQQGTFLYIVHCLLNKEVREEYIKWLTCSIGKEAAEEKDVGSVTEDFDKPENQNNEGKKDH
ncbi:unnamed protein product [Oreochromis niloticus]|nr:unnamed protein product [Mustela putorius furo]